MRVRLPGLYIALCVVLAGVIHVVAGDERDARRAALRESREPDSAAVEEVLPLGCEIDHDPGVVWDSGRTGRRYPQPPVPPEEDE